MTTFDPRITAYFGDAVLQAGFMPVPNLFMRHYRQLGLSTVQAMFVLQLMEIAWDMGDPPNSVSKLAARMGVGERSIRLYGEELRDKNLVEIYDQFDEDTGAQVENGYDLSGLFRQLATLAPVHQRTGQRRLQRARSGAAGDDASQGVPPSHLDVNASLHAEQPVGHETPAVISYLGGRKNITSSPGKNITAAQGTELPSPQVTSYPGPRYIDSALNTDEKNPRKKAGRRGERSDAAADPPRQVAVLSPTPPPVEGGYSLRRQQALVTAEVARSRDVLAYMRLNAAVVDIAAPAMHPAECWALWAYARARNLHEGWIAEQVADMQTRRPRLSAHGRTFDAAGRMLAELPLAHAAAVLDIAARHCPDDHVGMLSAPDWQEMGAQEVVATARAALDTLWAVMAEERRPREQRGGRNTASKRRHPGQQPTSGDRLLQHALDVVESTVDPPSQDAWATARDTLRTTLDAAAWDTWIQPLSLEHVDEAMVVLTAPNVFVRDQIAAAFEQPIACALAEALGHEVCLEVVIGPYLSV